MKRVLDAGCGTGHTSLKLIERGYVVTALTPDSYQAALCRRRLDGAAGVAEVAEVRLEDFSPERPYDLVLLSESSQYIKQRRLFPAILRCLEPGGYALIADYFRKERRRFYRHCQVDEEFVREADRAGMKLMQEIDVTSRAAPTLEFARKLFDRYGKPFLAATRDAAREHAPVLSRVLPLVFRRTFRRLCHYLDEKAPSYMDAGRFARELRYVVRLFRYWDVPVITSSHSAPE